MNTSIEIQLEKLELETIDNIGKYPVPKFDLIPNYLKRMYGVNWRIPDANFQHN